ncbi:MAG: Ribonuclease P protein component [Candidatus Uhrbacteria bacterium GW2011_GWF2_39_13]|uniref:Ribonuclease P protein component n=1 Tax=Candidatus Uhrbacteria bacterium GW2011_GWF2_39_13 TaxID=1618995 RepID=A0A0G0MJQ8_9BACT|nr:MAG: Ribonuclease P protein component [Candidatus Uhrbacteria bacterium GW2011_GWF2_39_13]HAU65813.1 ribonuclease P protein component [Candidatus Uhrbacteria bacterium]
MLSPEYRLRHEKDIKALFARGKSVFGIWLGMKFQPNKLPVSRFAVVVGTKVSKKAVVRNRLKRQIRAVIQVNLLQINPGYDILFFLKKEAVGKDFEEISKQVVQSLKKARLLSV